MRRKDWAGCGGRAIKKPREQKSPKISSYFPALGCLRGGSAECEDLGGRSTIFQDPYIIDGLKIFLIHRTVYAILHIIWSSDFPLWVLSKTPRAQAGTRAGARKSNIGTPIFEFRTTSY